MTSDSIINVEIPATISAALGIPRQVRVHGVSVSEVIEELCKDFPELKPRLLDDKGEVHRFVNLYVNGVDIRELNGTLTLLKNPSQLTILSAISGG